MAALVLAACVPKPAVSATEFEIAGDSDSKRRYNDREPLGPPPSIDASVPGANYLKAVSTALQPPWSSFLKDCRVRLPADHPLNVATLVVTLDISVDRAGAITAVAIHSPSGHSEFDQVANEIARDLESLPQPPDEWISDDDRAHLRWSFARDERQAGPATASLFRFELPLEEALPKLLAASQISAAASRILQSATGAEVQRHLRVVASDVLRASLSEGDPEIATSALGTIAAARLSGLLGPVRDALGSGEINVAVAAAHALAVIGDESDAARLRGLALQGEPPLSEAAANALVALGEADGLAEAALKGLRSDNAQTRAAAIAVFSRVDSLDAVVPLGAVMETAESRSERVAAARALGAQAQKSPRALNVLLVGTEAKDAVLRASSVQAVASAAKNGMRSRVAYWRILELLRDKDERVRAAAIQAAAALDPARFSKELKGIKAGGSGLVLLSFARALGAVPGDVALRRLLDLAGVDDVSMRQAAAEGLAQRRDARATQALRDLLGDDAPAVRQAALDHLKSAEELQPLLEDRALEVQASALRALVALLGEVQTAAIAGKKLAEAGNERGTQVLWIRSWLAGKGATD